MDVFEAIQSMLLTAWADGVGSNCVGFGGLEKAKALLEHLERYGAPVRVG